MYLNDYVMSVHDGALKLLLFFFNHFVKLAHPKNLNDPKNSSAEKLFKKHK
jgi:hypothetical protein